MDRQGEEAGDETERPGKGSPAAERLAEGQAEACAAAGERADPPVVAREANPGGDAGSPEMAGPDDDSAAPRERHDAFNEARKAAFVAALAKAGCILDACRATGTAPRTVYRHQESDPAFLANCQTALKIAATPIEFAAWRRAVEGVEQEFACGGQVHVRRRYSDGLLRLLLQASNPKKYGPNPGFRRKRLLKHERKQIEREVRAQLGQSFRPRTFDEVKDSILRKLAAIERHHEPEKLAAGWTKSPDGHWIPPGYGRLPGGAAEPGGEAAGGKTPRDSV